MEQDGQGFILRLESSSFWRRGRKTACYCLTPGNSDDRAVFRKMNDKLKGLFVADAGYVSEELERAFCIENKRAVITASRKNMKKLATPFQIALLNLRMRVEIHFRILKVCYGLVTSLPRSIDGYLTHYLAAIAAHLLA